MSSSLRQRLSRREILVAPGAYDALTAKLIQASGFEAVYLSGAGVSYATLGWPDLGLVTQTELAARVAMLANAVSLPVIADGDTGHGNANNAARCVQLYERAGAQAIQLEDQIFPKRCGHMAGKALVDAQEMVEKLQAALQARRSREFLVIARTDALGVAGMDEALDRGRRYLEAGADALFVEAPRSHEELRTVARAFPATPLVANMVEGGRTPLLPAAELQELGYALLIHPNALARRFAKAGLQLLGELKRRGSTAHLLDDMLLFEEFNALLQGR